MPESDLKRTVEIPPSLQKQLEQMRKQYEAIISVQNDEIEQLKKEIKELREIMGLGKSVTIFF